MEENALNRLWMEGILIICIIRWKEGPAVPRSLSELQCKFVWHSAGSHMKHHQYVYLFLSTCCTTLLPQYSCISTFLQTFITLFANLQVTTRECGLQKAIFLLWPLLSWAKQSVEENKMTACAHSAWWRHKIFSAFINRVHSQWRHNKSPEMSYSHCWVTQFIRHAKIL